jgi:hypothetical protein
MYRLYIGHDYRYTDENKIKSNDINYILQQLDYCILTQKMKRTKYLLIENRNNQDQVIFLNYGDEQNYLDFKKGILMMKEQEKHFKKEDLAFIDYCMRQGECNGCKKAKLCQEIESLSKKPYIKGKK